MRLRRPWANYRPHPNSEHRLPSISFDVLKSVNLCLNLL
jgi:hypothetical protein